MRRRGADGSGVSALGEPTRLNLGCGLQAPPGWVNIDRSPGLLLDKARFAKPVLRRIGLLRDEQMTSWPQNVWHLDVTRRPLPFGDRSVDAIYSSHMLEHLYFEDALAVVHECRRVLRQGGVLRLALPDAEPIAAGALALDPDSGLAEALALTQGLHMAPLARPSRKAAILGGLGSSYHRWQPTYALVAAMMRRAGFVTIDRREFLRGNLPDLLAVEHREESLFVEATA